MSLKNSQSQIFQNTIPDDSIGLQFWLLHNKWQRAVSKELKTIGISHTQFVILTSILWYEEQAVKPIQSEIAQLIKLDKMTLSKALTKLIANHYASKKKCTKDTRALSLTLTEKGRKLACSAVKKIETVDKKIFGMLGKEKTSIFNQLLREYNI